MSESTPGWASPGGGEQPPPAPAPEWGQSEWTQPGWTQQPSGWAQPGWGQPRPPDPKPGIVPLRPLGLGEILDGAVALVRRYPRPVLGLSVVLAIIATALNVTLAVTVLKPIIAADLSSLESGDPASANQVDGYFGGQTLGSIGSLIINGLSGLILTGVVAVVASRGVLGQHITLGEAWRVVRPAMWRLVGLSILTTVMVWGSFALGVTLFIVLIATAGVLGGVIGFLIAAAATCLAVHLYCRLALAPCSLILERAGIRTSMRRSGILVRRSWWRVCGVLLLAMIVAAVVGNVIQLPFAVFGVVPALIRGRGLADGVSRLLVLTYIGAGLAQTVVAPFTAGVRALLYVDRRMRAEGLDVALTAAAAQPVA